MDLRFSPKSRAKTLATVILSLLAVFVLRLFYIQVIQHAAYVAQADSEHIKQFTLHAKRGEIYTMDGDQPTKLVMNETVYTVWVDPQEVENKNEIVSAVNEIAGGNARDNFAQYIDKKSSRYQVIATKVSRTQAEMLKRKISAVSGLTQ